MAAPGSTQHRELTSNRLLEDRRLIEAEIKQLLFDQNQIKKDNKSIDKRILSDVENKADLVKKSLEQQLKQEQALFDAEKKARMARGTADEAEFQRKADLKKFGLDEMKTRTRMAKLQYDESLKILKIEQDVLKTENSRFEKAQNFLSKFGDIFSFQKKYYDVLKESVGLEGTRLMLAASMLAILASTFEIFKKMDDSLAKFRIEMGMLRPDVQRISRDIREVATQFTHVGVTVEGAADATKALANEFGGVRIISKDLVETTSLLKAQLGVSEESSAGFLRNISALSKSTAQTQKGMAYVAQNLTAAAGVPLNLVMQDVAKMSANALALVSRMPMQIVKAATAARQMGTTINKIADASAQLLNFTENVQAEMEASVLVGQSVNLQLARELAYRRDIVGSTKAILAEARRINFENLDYFQMQSFAAATGRSTDELLKMIQAQRQLREARGIEGLKEEVALIDKINSMQESQLKNSGLQTETAVKQMANQARLVALQNQWNQLLMETLRVLYPVFDLLLKIGIVAVKMYPVVFGSIAAITGGFQILASTLSFISKILISIKGGMSIFSGVAMSIATLGKGLSKVAGFFKSLLGVGAIFSKFSFLAPFAKAIPVIGWIISGIQFLYNWGKRLITIYNDPSLNFGQKILAGLKAIGPALWDTLIQPFIDVYDWVMKWLGGHSPSQIGLSIVKGIVGVQAMIFDALTSPFRRFLAWIAEKIPGMGKLAETLRGGMTGGLQKAVTIEPKPVAVMTEAPATIKSSVAVESNSQEKATKERDSNLLSEILKAVNLLNANLSAGKIGVYIDGQLMSATLARQTAFRGGYGTNQVSIG